jgi:hypothetical protein
VDVGEGFLPNCYQNLTNKEIGDLDATDAGETSHYAEHATEVACKKSF